MPVSAPNRYLWLEASWRLLIVARLRGLRFEPAGLTDDTEITEVTSVMDYVAQRLAADFMSKPV